MPIIKEKKPSGLVFSLCKTSVLVRMTEGAALAGRFVYTQEGERLPAEGRARRNPPSSPHPGSVRVGNREGATGSSVAPYDFLRKSS